MASTHHLNQYIKAQIDKALNSRVGSVRNGKTQQAELQHAIESSLNGYARRYNDAVYQVNSAHPEDLPRVVASEPGSLESSLALEILETGRKAEEMLLSEVKVSEIFSQRCYIDVTYRPARSVEYVRLNFDVSGV